MLNTVLVVFSWFRYYPKVATILGLTLKFGGRISSSLEKAFTNIKCLVSKCYSLVYVDWESSRNIPASNVACVFSLRSDRRLTVSRILAQGRQRH